MIARGLPLPHEMTTAIPSIALPGGETIPVLGQGTWQHGRGSARRAEEIAALRPASISA